MKEEIKLYLNKETSGGFAIYFWRSFAYEHIFSIDIT